MTAFHPFPRLPLELREQIWKDTIEPRTVDVRRTRKGTERYGQLVSSTPIPAMLQSCREARNLGLYERVFFEVTPATKQLKGKNEAENAMKRFFTLDERGEEGPKKAGSPDTEQRYVWLDLNIDMVDIGASRFCNYESVASAVKRLKFERENSEEYFYHTESTELMNFASVEEIHIVCADGFWMWAGATHEHSWPCAEEKLVFIDAFNGRVARGIEFEKICIQTLEDAWLGAPGEAFSTDDES
ncbi:hypothetical protein J4E82_000557 [Alternaria postmessia]|jgi:hypothetical protein|uniref:uncharacterized protein n=1 Tax=Alternaria postmessia TaxID=1187938 RepID=UPI002224F5E7|nr:uncharacterized protein J4E82_000557 [Alternaria postmessia]KAI5380600.1 hypothetical protein J4E82_000557 [Alternaria postmessia]